MNTHGFAIEFYETATGKVVKKLKRSYDTASESAAVFIAFLNYWERYYGHQTEYAWRDA